MHTAASTIAARGVRFLLASYEGRGNCGEPRAIGCMEKKGGASVMARAVLIFWDFVLSFMWVWSGALIKIIVYQHLGLGSLPKGEVVKSALSVLNMFFFAWLAQATRGGSYNPLTIVSGAFSGKFSAFVFTLFGRIPAQVFGSIIGVKLIIDTFPGVGRGPRLNTDIHLGALTEGIISFAIVLVSCGLKKKDPNSFFIRTWISSIFKLTLHILGSDFTGGCMNPASAMGWAYARGEHITKEHLFVYWLAPLKATLIAVLTFNFIVQPKKQQQKLKQNKAEKADKVD